VAVVPGNRNEEKIERAHAIVFPAKEALGKKRLGGRVECDGKLFLLGRALAQLNSDQIQRHRSCPRSHNCEPAANILLDNFPAGLVIATPASASNRCGGTFTATAGAASISLSGGTIAASASCAVSVNVTSTNGGTGNTGTATLGSGDFTISVSPSTQTIPAGHMAVYTLTISSTTGFQGTVNLTCSGGPAKSTCTLIPLSVTLVTSAETSKVTVDLAVPKGASLGAFTLTFTGTSGALTVRLQR
jgi:hypothetical protein